MENSSYIKDRDKSIQDLERYKIIGNYFSGNPNLVGVNRNAIYIDEIRDSLRKFIPKEFRKSFFQDIDASDKNIQEKVRLIALDRESNGFYSEVKELSNLLSYLSVDSIISKMNKIKETRQKEGKSI